MDLTVDGYLKALVREGNPPESVLAETFAAMRVEYADAMGDHEYRAYLDVMRELTRMEVTLTQIENLIEVSRTAFHPVLGRELNRLLSYELPWPEDRETINASLDKAFRRSRALVLRIAIKNQQLEGLRSKYEGAGIRPTREYYGGLLITLSDEAGYPIPDSITVWEFCERIKRANKKAQILNAKTNGRRTH